MASWIASRDSWGMMASPSLFGTRGTAVNANWNLRLITWGRKTGDGPASTCYLMATTESLWNVSSVRRRWGVAQGHGLLLATQALRHNTVTGVIWSRVHGSRGAP